MIACPGRAASVHFNRDIRPILSDRCFQCHGPNEHDRRSYLRLDQPDGEEGAFRSHEGTTAIKPKSLQESELWRRINSDDQDEVMPPPDAHKKSLSRHEKELLKQWILEGAEFQEFWAFVPPQTSLPPTVENSDWSRGLIDDQVLANLEKKGLQPNSEADRRTLIRRLRFDLTGLPPTLDEIHDFVQDDSSDAYAKLVERLLDTPQYGEHMARYWADLVRLADTNGMHKDFYRNFSTYRDWLIRAFNENLPFDDFIMYQLAGDLYPEPTQDQLVASGFNRLHLIIDSGTALPEESFHKNVLDRVEAFGTTFLGLTVQCAQCHEHKYDPISQKEYYQLYAFFNNFDGAPETGHAPKNGIQPPFITLAAPEIKTDIARAPPKTKQDRTPAKDVLEQERGTETTASVTAMVMKEKAVPTPTHMLIRGAYDAPGELVSRNTPAFLPPLKEKEGVYSRMDLAEWLVEPQHPLTARVAANRFWQQFFGVGLVKTAEDFGAQGEWPSHPQLLDSLALRFIESGWDIKDLVREIVHSSTYRQSSDADPVEFDQDPENRQLARGSRYRMDAEMIRDQILFLGSKLNIKMYGQSVKPPQPPGLWKAVSMSSPVSYVPDTGDAIYRRSFYTFWRRSMPPPQMTIMNAPSREYCVARRERTNTPLLALLLMNEPEYFEAAKACAENTLAEAGGDDQRGLSLVYEKVTSHRPSQQRIALMERALNDFRTYYENNPALADSLTDNREEVDGLACAELAAWTMMTHSLFNLELTKVRR
ncbi:MAG: PSD1 and planctomycete cytochrome C domain-containing protein [Pirellulales bacterium]|nr:PSD1 and planctomycete cytochrome C domain-containing protein [Pirellulales bacterium]